jgi:hypothetical protein
MNPRPPIELRELGQVGARRGTAEPRSVDYSDSEARGTPSNEFRKGASRRRASPGSQPGLLRCTPSALRAGLHRREDKPQHQAAASLQAQALPGVAGLVYKQRTSVTSQEPRPNPGRSTGAPTAWPPGPRSACGSSCAARARRPYRCRPVSSTLGRSMNPRPRISRASAATRQRSVRVGEGLPKRSTHSAYPASEAPCALPGNASPQGRFAPPCCAGQSAWPVPSYAQRFARMSAPPLGGQSPKPSRSFAAGKRASKSRVSPRVQAAHVRHQSTRTAA